MFLLGDFGEIHSESQCVHQLSWETGWNFRDETRNTAASVSGPGEWTVFSLFGAEGQLSLEAKAYACRRVHFNSSHSSSHGGFQWVLAGGTRLCCLLLTVLSFWFGNREYLSHAVIQGSGRVSHIFVE
jgi:hypothetical protein